MTSKKPLQKFGLSFRKDQNFGEWYQQLVIRSELLDYYDISGCYIMRPSCMFIWNAIKAHFTAQINKRNVREVYFPMLVRKESIEKEKQHIDNFQPELAWVTRCGDSEIEPVALRPTSESIFYPSFAKWLRSYRDLPLKVNQWCNVVRWEVKSTTPLLRGREFLWQEGHTVHFAMDEAAAEVRAILHFYERVYVDLLAVPVIKGTKTENEKFGGAFYTETVEAFIPGSGRGIQAATSHNLGCNFAKMYDVKVTDMDEGERFVYQTSWGLTTRSIGIAVMVHSDDRGLVVPPRVAEIQVVVVPCGVDNNEGLMNYIDGVVDEIRQCGIRVEVDLRKNVSPGFKFNHWELRGIPVRLEIGPRDMQKQEICVVCRHNLKKKQVPREGFSAALQGIMDEIHEELYAAAVKERNERLKRVKNWPEFMEAINGKCLALAPWCKKSECEIAIRQRSECNVGGEALMGAKSLCIPFNENEGQIEDGVKCVGCEEKAECWCLFGRCY